MNIPNNQEVEILVGDHAGEIAVVTWADDNFVRVTPLDGGPLVSIQLGHDEIVEV